MVAATQAQRAALYTNLVDLMGQEAAESLMDELPPGGWHHMAAKDDVATAEQRLQASLAVAMAETSAKFAETNARITDISAGLQVAMQAGFTEVRMAIATGLAEAAKERVESAKERAEIVRGQARQLYVIVSTIAAATISIWIALFTSAAGA